MLLQPCVSAVSSGSSSSTAAILGRPLFLNIHCNSNSTAELLKTSQQVLSTEFPVPEQGKSCQAANTPPRTHKSVAALLQVPDASYDFVAQNQGLVRSLPLWAGGLGFVSLLANRTLSGVSIAAALLL